MNELRGRDGVMSLLIFASVHPSDGSWRLRVAAFAPMPLAVDSAGVAQLQSLDEQGHVTAKYPNR